MMTSASAYFIHADGEYGTFFLRSEVNRYGNTWLELTINSSFGTYGHTFGAIGGTPAEFLSDVEFDYLMGKLMGKGTEVFDMDTAARSVRRLVMEKRYHRDISRDQALELWELVDEAVESCWDNENVFFAMLMDNDRFHRWDVYECECRVVNPQATGLWEKLWPAFIAELKDVDQVAAA